MSSLGWTFAGFVAGAVATAAAFVALPPLTALSPAVAPVAEAPDAPAQTATVLQPTEDEENGEPEVLTNDPLGDLDVVARIAIMRWMAANPQYEFITRDYCGCHDIAVTNCPEYDARRERALRDYPYSEVSDYNKDKRNDFAVMLGEKDKEGPQIMLIFNAPFSDAIPEPAFTATGWARNDRISGGYAGTPESDNGYNITPKGTTYELVYIGNPH